MNEGKWRTLALVAVTLAILEAALLCSQGEAANGWGLRILAAVGVWLLVSLASVGAVIAVHLIGELALERADREERARRIQLG